MTKIALNTISDIEKLNRKLKQLSVMLQTLREFAIQKTADDTILTSIHRDMESNGFSKKIIDRTYVGEIQILSKGKKIIVHFISDYTSDDGFDVSTAREEGTTDHDVFPLSPDGWLTFIDPNTGKRIFSKHTHPSGIKRLLLIENNINSNKQKFEEAYRKEISAQVNQVLSV